MSGQLLSIIVAAMVFCSIALLYLGIRSARARAATPEMEDRLERFGQLTDPFVSGQPERESRSMLAVQVEKAVGDRGFSVLTKTALVRADLRMTVGEWILVRIGSALVFFLLGMFLGRSSLFVALLFGLLMAGLGWMVPQFYLSYRAKRRQKLFVNQLGDTISLMANSLRAGYSLMQTMELVARESPAPMSEEFGRVVREVGLGISPNQALNNLLRRIPSEDLDLLISAINIQHEVGGNLGQILDIIGETIRERVRIQGEIGVLTAQQQLSGYVIVALPIVLGLGLFAMNTSYMSQMLVWPWICMPIAAGILELVGFLVMRKIIAIEV
jgi:tight adherence protein B